MVFVNYTDEPARVDFEGLRVRPNEFFGDKADNVITEVQATLAPRSLVGAPVGD